MRPLLTAVVGLGTWREHLDDDLRVGDSVWVFFVHDQVATDDGKVGVGGEPCRFDSNLEVTAEYTTCVRIDQAAEGERDLGDESRVLGSAPRHREDLPADELQFQSRRLPWP